MRIKDERRRLGLYSHTEVRELLGVSSGWVQQFPARHLLGRRYYYDAADLDQMRRSLENPHPNYQTVERDRKTVQGWYSIKSAARAFGIPGITWQKNVSEGRVPRPSHRVGACWYYSRDDAETIAATIAGKRRPLGCLTAEQLARRVGMSRCRLAWYFRKWTDIGTTVGPKRRWFSEDDVEEVRRRLDHARRPAAMMSTREVASRLGLSFKQFKNKLYPAQDKRGSAWGRKVGGKLHFTLTEVMEMRRAFGLPPPVVPML